MITYTCITLIIRVMMQSFEAQRAFEKRFGEFLKAASDDIKRVEFVGSPLAWNVCNG